MRDPQRGVLHEFHPDPVPDKQNGDDQQSEGDPKIRFFEVVEVGVQTDIQNFFLFIFGELGAFGGEEGFFIIDDVFRFRVFLVRLR